VNKKEIKKKTSPLLGKYLVKNKVLYFFLMLTDHFFSFFIIKKKKIYTKTPSRILISNIAHMGDAVIATSVLPAIKKRFPNSKVGCLIGSVSCSIFNNHPMVDFIHVFDHWKLNRKNISFWQKLLVYYRTRKQAVSGIKSKKYDVAIDLYYYFPNSIPLLWSSKIPRRIGYSSAGFSCLLTDAINWHNVDDYVYYYHKKLLELIPISSDILEKNVNITLPAIDQRDAISLEKKMMGWRHNEYIILHMGAGASVREWPEDKWQELSSLLVKEKKKLVFTGRGEGEKNKIKRVTNNLNNCLDLSDTLAFNELTLLVKQSLLVISSDTLITHIAKAMNKQSLMFCCGLSNPYHWLNKDMGVLLCKKTNCYPCYCKRQCTAMTCIRDIDVNHVITLALDKTNFNNLTN
jgi:ADP-heptose:LPS heptosyltransferase